MFSRMSLEQYQEWQAFYAWESRKFREAAESK